MAQDASKKRPPNPMAVTSESPIRSGCRACGGSSDDDSGASFSNGWLCRVCGFYRSEARGNGPGKAS
jgi:hypothetical protein